MEGVRIFLAVLFALSVSVFSVRAAPSVFPLKEVKPGLKGECRTVFAGTRIQSFPFEVMGIGKDFAGPGRDIIWCKMLGDPTGQMVVAGGMSGSPCLIEGRTMGALAYGWTFNKDPIFGVQPIESMLELFKFKGNERRWSGSWFAAHGAAQPEAPRLLSVLAGFVAPIGALSSSDEAQLVPLPLEIGGLHPLIAGKVEEALREAGFWPMLSAGGGVSAAADAADLEPGSPITGVIAQGDLNMAATGTLTWRDGDKVLAFGHPFLNAGSVGIPMGKAEIVGVVSSYERSFKMANKGGVVGMLTQDRMSAVAGRIGLMPKMTPMTVKISQQGLPTRTYHLKFCDNKYFTPAVYQSALLQFFANVMERSEESTLRLKSEIQLEGAPPLRFEDVFAGERFGWVINAVVQAGQQLMPIYQNEFAVPAVKSISVEAEIRPLVQSMTIEELVVEPLKAHPGEKVHVRAVFQPWHGPRIRHEYEVTIPEEAKSGELELVAADAVRAGQIEGVGSTAVMGFGGFSGGARDLKQLVDGLNDRHRNDRLYLFVLRNTEGLLLQNQRLPALPASVRQLMNADQSTDHPRGLTTAVLSKTEIPLDAVVLGSRSVKITIK